LMAPLQVQEAAGIAALEAAAARQEPLALFWRRGEGADSAAPIGVSCGIVRLIRLPDGQMQVVLQGIARVRRLAVTATEPHLRVLVEAVQPPQVSIVGNPLREAVLNSLRAVAALSGVPEQALVVAANAQDAGQLADIAAGVLDLPAEDRQRVLEAVDPIPRLELVLQLAEQRRGYLEVSQRIQREVGERAGREQRAYLLREQLRAIRRELGELDPSEGQIAELRQQVEGKGLPAEVRAEAERELGRLEAINPASPEWAVIRTRLDWILALPWEDPPPDTVDLERARQVLDADHLGLEKVKDRILDYLAVTRLRGGARGPILCLVGPPGVGKTSLGQSIARALGRPFVRASLGGIRDEAEIRGHRRTYVGALPGRIIQGMRRAGARNPVFMLDEVDKLGAGFQGDPAAALLEVLDPAQNHAFVDHYLDLSYDLSRVFFICTANVTFSIPEALLDRMEVIEIPGYTDQEKLGIARRHLLRRQMEEHGLPEGALRIDDAVLLDIVRGWTREAGVRQLDRALAAICRRAARRRAAGDERPLEVDERVVSEALGPRRVDEAGLEEETSVGAATGLAWTGVGGDILTVEASVVPGDGKLTLTGSLGEVMQESARAAITYARSRSARLGLDPDFFQRHDLHIHVPEGAIPKDGPSAGVALATALISAATGRAVDRRWAMTGEITLRGLVLPVGGIKEKALAAHRAGLRGVILPRRNERNLVEVPEEVRQALEWRLVDTADQVLEVVLRDPPAAVAPAAAGAQAGERPAARAVRRRSASSRASGGMGSGSRRSSSA
ncbi:MAG TPA: endopeptidase La, partial [Candidatus Dormibacteraeota bacterium]|nr:endopeptidase La [Candidatus Dormibacteraeota bacterium]